MSSGILFLVVWAFTLPVVAAAAHFSGKAPRGVAGYMSVAAVGGAWLVFTGTLAAVMATNYHHVDGAVGWAAERDMFLDIFATGAGMSVAIVCCIPVNFMSHYRMPRRAEPDDQGH